MICIKSDLQITTPFCNIRTFSVNKNLIKIETKCKMQIISMYVENFLSRTVNTQPTYIVKVQVLQCAGPTTFIHMKFLKNSEQDEFLLEDVLLEQDVSSPIELF